VPLTNDEKLHSFLPSFDNVVSSEHLEMTNSFHIEAILQDGCRTSYRSGRMKFLGSLFLLVFFLLLHNTIWCKTCKQHSEKNFEILNRKILCSSNLLEPGMELHLPKVIFFSVCPF